MSNLNDVKNWSNGNRVIAILIAVIGIFVGMQLLKLFFALAFVITIILTVCAAGVALYFAVKHFQQKRTEEFQSRK